MVGSIRGVRRSVRSERGWRLAREVESKKGERREVDDWYLFRFGRVFAHDTLSREMICQCLVALDHTKHGLTDETQFQHFLKISDNILRLI